MGIFEPSFEEDVVRYFSQFKTTDEFVGAVLKFANELKTVISDKHHRHNSAALSWRVRLFNSEGHFLFPHQQEAVGECIREIALSKQNLSGYCFMPTSGGKSYIIFTLAALGISDFKIFNILDAETPEYLNEYPASMPIWISVSLMFTKLTQKEKVTKTQILVHDIAILDQLEQEARQLLGNELAELVQFTSVQSHGNQKRRQQLKYVIIDECHWGNATQEETVQSDLVEFVKISGGRAFGFTASPYENPAGKFQKTWSKNKINGDRDFNYFLERNIIYPIKLKEVNLQNARVDYEIGDEEVELTEKSQVVDFIANNILTTIPQGGLNGPAICFFSPVIIPDIVGELLANDNYNQVKPFIKVLGSPESAFMKKCEARFGKEILADDEVIKQLKVGEKIFLISQQKLLVGLNAPHLRYCFISPTNSKIKILQGIGRLMRPCSEVDEKLAVLYLASLSGKKMDIGESGTSSTESEPCNDCGLKVCDCACEVCGQPRNTECECPKARYVSSSMTLSEAYDLPHKVFYKEVVGFSDFINERRINDPNTVYKIPTRHIDPIEWDNFDVKKALAEQQELRRKCFVIYKNDILKRDHNACVECKRGQGEVNLEIHHVSPYEFNELYRTRGYQGTIEWHSDPKNWKYLITLCDPCHKEHHKADDEAA